MKTLLGINNENEFLPFSHPPRRHQQKEGVGRADFLEAQNFSCLGTLTESKHNQSTVPVMS